MVTYKDALNIINMDIDYKLPCIYKITNILNGKFYVGSTKNGLEKRLKRHFGDKNGCTKLASAIKKHGKDFFDVCVLEYCSKNDILIREQYWLDKLQPYDEGGYNLSKKAYHFNGEFTEQHRQNISNSLKGRIPWNKGKTCSDETKSKLKLLSTGRKHTEESKLKISKANKNKIISEETRKKLSEAAKKRTLTKEHKEKIANSLKNKKLSEDHKIKIGLAHKGKKRSEETRQKMSLALKGKPAWNKGLKINQ
jgi:group I intron endonuclease